MILKAINKLTMDGASAIHAERHRQENEKGWSAVHDDGHTDGSLATAALAYLTYYRSQSALDKEADLIRAAIYWPWEEDHWKPSDNPLRNLEKAGALIAAEYDRLQREQGKVPYNAVKGQCEMLAETIKHNREEHPLARMFKMQEELNARCAPECDDVVKFMKNKMVALHSHEDKQTLEILKINPVEQDMVTKWMLNFIRATQQELSELVDSLPWKWWAKYQKLDIQNARVEVVDIFHFVISLAQVLGMSADDVVEMYEQKNKVNHNRQDSGYTEKDENDSRHIIGGVGKSAEILGEGEVIPAKELAPVMTDEEWENLSDIFCETYSTLRRDLYFSRRDHWIHYKGHYLLNKDGSWITASGLPDVVEGQYKLSKLLTEWRNNKYFSRP